MKKNSKGHYDLPRSWKRNAVVILLLLSPVSLYLGGLSFMFLSWGLFLLALIAPLVTFATYSETKHLFHRGNFPDGGYGYPQAVSPDSKNLYVSQILPVPTSPPRTASRDCARSLSAK